MQICAQNKTQHDPTLLWLQVESSGLGFKKTLNQISIPSLTSYFFKPPPIIKHYMSILNDVA